ncbi:2-alkyl-3-oxoalkanoate reductase [Colwellia psychrerythraea]|uniref:Sterol-4-alpha-carboxylate 3-dehydrogenase (Decarboxylating) n=1 Tax=Colwellia psychrerythraea TaxID=28229 RepID=A0A099KV39_COLPS|nr:2-alkyl-3-oxoalkanoate reductase [Colwellia psychrerythraea]KGJ93528.1 Sterol-4-alpha-carboxylate 3-dehydrogenase (decarboxylating) [Colwellia psychrerythraea]
MIEHSQSSVIPTHCKANSTDVIAHFNEVIQAPLNELATQANHVFVTGAGGFLGKAICRLLRLAGIRVTGFARGNYPELEQMGVKMVQGDITDYIRLKEAMKTCDLVFHVAAKAGVWGSKEDYFEPNVQGAKNVIQACQELEITRLVYTSTPSVTFAGVDEAGIDESTSYAHTFLNFYGESKALAEQLVLAASNPPRQAHGHAEEPSQNVKSEKVLKTVALRPHLIWGPNDPHLVPRVLERARAGKLKLVGNEDKLVDTIFVDNAAYAHILAAVVINRPEAICSGKAYFISNDQPITMAAMLNKILHCVDLPPVTKRVPTSVAYAVGATLEWFYKTLNIKHEPVMTRFVARQLSTCHYFDISAAKKDLGYTPLISIEEGMKQLKLSLEVSN